MPDPTSNPTPTPTPNPTPGDPPPNDPEPVTPEPNDQLGDAGQRALENERAARKAAEKAARQTQAELEKLRQASMTEQEKAVAQAKAEGRAEGLAAGTAKVARAEIRAAATGRLGPDQISTLLENVNLAAFIGDDGEVDEVKVAKFVDGITPPADEEPLTQRFPDLGQGARGSGKTLPLNGDPLERDLKNKLGIR